MTKHWYRVLMKPGLDNPVYKVRDTFSKALEHFGQTKELNRIQAIGETTDVGSQCRYVLLHATLNSELMTAVKGIKGVKGFMNFMGGDQPEIVPDDLAQREIEGSQRHVAPFAVGDLIRVIKGPHANSQALVVDVLDAQKQIEVSLTKAQQLLKLNYDEAKQYYG